MTQREVARAYDAGYKAGYADAMRARGSGREERDLELAIEQLSATIHRHLVDVPPTGYPVQGLTQALIDNLARNMVGALDEYGYEDDDER